MDEFWKKTVWSQFGAGIDARESALTACPDEVWGDPSKKPDPGMSSGTWSITPCSGSTST